MKKGVLIFLCLQALVIIGGAIFLYVRVPKTAYINTNKVYNEFKGKAEYQTKLEALNATQKQILDTTKFEIELLQRRLSQNLKNKELMSQYDVKARNYERLRQEFEQNIETQRQKYIEEIWKQINKYVEEYGNEKGFDYIYGTEGSGAIMYAKSSLDISKEVTVYVNKKYEGF